MAGKIINNSESLFQETKSNVDCKKYNRIATIIANYMGTKWTDADLHKTYRLSGWKCSLAQKFSGCGSLQCFDCPHEPKKYL